VHVTPPQTASSVEQRGRAGAQRDDRLTIIQTGKADKSQAAGPRGGPPAMRHSFLSL